MKDQRLGNGIIRRAAAYLLTLLLPLAGLAFGAGQVEKDSKLAKKIERGKSILVLTPEGQKTMPLPVILEEGVAGRFVQSGRDAAAGAYDPSTLIRWSDVQSIQVQKSAAMLGGLIGFAVVGGGFAAIVTAAAEGDVLVGPLMLAAVAAGVVVGGLPGALIGSTIKRWKTVYAAPAGSGPAARFSVVPARRGGLALSVTVTF
jgi:hypothetical protein